MNPPCRRVGPASRYKVVCSGLIIICVTISDGFGIQCRFYSQLPFFDAPPGFEPGLTEPKSVALPLRHGASYIYQLPDILATKLAVGLVQPQLLITPSTNSRFVSSAKPVRLREMIVSKMSLASCLFAVCFISLFR